jgi:hypothetical protein
MLNHFTTPSLSILSINLYYIVGKAKFWTKGSFLNRRFIIFDHRDHQPRQSRPPRLRNAVLELNGLLQIYRGQYFWVNDTSVLYCIIIWFDIRFSKKKRKFSIMFKLFETIFRQIDMSYPQKYYFLSFL